MTLKDLFEKFVKEKAYIKNVSDSTVRFYQASWAITEKYLRVKHAEELTRDVLKDLVFDWKEKSKQSPKSINTYISFVNSFLSWLHAEGYTQQHHKMQKLKVEETIFRIFNESHIKTILRYRPQGYYEQRMWHMLCLILDTGLRISEVLEIKESDIRFDQSLIIVKGREGESDLSPSQPRCENTCLGSSGIGSKSACPTTGSFRPQPNSP